MVIYNGVIHDFNNGVYIGVLQWCFTMVIYNGVIQYFNNGVYNGAL